ncbi:YchJ family metal-binding protein, partial [Vibrio cholerae]|uniref:YchJ family metal-binding protein n=1 Tax=Vibrio cholerae TaxID=666 RepID=UPI001F078ADF
PYVIRLELNADDKLELDLVSNRLEIISTQMGATPNEGFVHFKAFLEQEGEAFCLEERSRFLKENNCWFYIDGEFPTAIKQGRNDPCACGSGKKYKKCCG